MFKDDVVDAVGRAVCTYISGVDNANSWLQDTLSPLPVPNGPAAGLRGLLCDNPTPPPSSPSPFTGGQCDGTLYNVTFFSETVSGGRSDFGPTTVAYRGPLSNATGPNESETVADRGFTWTRSSGEKEYVRIIQNTQENTIGAGLTGAFPVSGPDDCGDPPPPPPPPFVPPRIPETIPDPTNPTGPPIPVDIDIFAPVVIGPSVFAPVRIEGPNFEIDGQINLSPEFNIEVGLGGSSGGSGGTSVPPDPDDVDPESPDEPVEPDGRGIVGAHVTLDFVGPARFSELAQDGDIGSIGVPRVATWYWVVSMGGARSRTVGVELKSRRTYVEVPAEMRAVSYRINLEEGATLNNVRLVYGTTRPA